MRRWCHPRTDQSGRAVSPAPWSSNGPRHRRFRRPLHGRRPHGRSWSPCPPWSCLPYWPPADRGCCPSERTSPRLTPPGPRCPSHWANRIAREHGAHAQLVVGHRDALQHIRHTLEVDVGVAELVLGFRENFVERRVVYFAGLSGGRKGSDENRFGVARDKRHLNTPIGCEKRKGQDSPGPPVGLRLTPDLPRTDGSCCS